MNKELEALKRVKKAHIVAMACLGVEKDDTETLEAIDLIETALKEKEKRDIALKDLMNNHIEFVVEKDVAYFKIKNSKGKEKSFTSYAFIDFWKEVLG